MFILRITIPFLWAIFCTAVCSRFSPETGGVAYQELISTLPAQYNLSESQVAYAGQNSNSYWSSSFITGSDNHQYLILSHILVGSDIGVYRTSILDITDTSYYRQSSTLFNGSTFLGGDFNFEFEDFYMGSRSGLSLDTINTSSSNKMVQFNLTYQFSSPILLNGGVGTFLWEYSTIVNEWSMPAGITTGTFDRNGTTVTVDPLKSLTWYDRQWQVGAATNWTWFELHLDNHPELGGSKMSVWFFPSGSGTTKAFATVRNPIGGHQVLPATLMEVGRTWTSLSSGWTYALGWQMELLDGTVLHIRTTRDDQELADPTKTFHTYEGFVEVNGTRKDEVFTGFGLVEIQPATNS